MVRAFEAATRQAAANLQPAEVAQVNGRPDPPLTFHRRVQVADLGEITCYYGFVVDEQERPDCSHVVRAALRALAGGRVFPVNAVEFDDQEQPLPSEGPSPLPIPEPWYLPPAADELAQGLFFRTLEGRPLGSIVRFPSHPSICGGSNRPHSGDYPAYVRRRAEEVFGGVGVFLTGPCGDQICPIGRRSLELAERIGIRVADTVLGGLAEADWQAEAGVAVASPEVELRIREDYPESREAARRERDEIESAFREAVRGGAGLAELKHMSDRYEFLTWVVDTQDGHRVWTGVDPCGRAGQVISHPLFLLRVGESVLAGLPGEPFGGLSAALRRDTIGERLIVLEEANGYLGYFPGAADYPRGGYEVTAALFGPESEEALRDAVRRALPALGV